MNNEIKTFEIIYRITYRLTNLGNEPFHVYPVLNLKKLAAFRFILTFNKLKTLGKELEKFQLIASHKTNLMRISLSSGEGL